MELKELIVLIVGRNLIGNERSGARMERLTKQFTDGTYYCEEVEDVGIEGINAPTYVGKAVNKLAEYEDAEEQGLLLRLPCKVGDTVYEIQPLTGKITPRTIKSIVICNAPELTIMYKSGYDYSNVQEDFGKTVFLTEEKAKQALKQMEEQEDKGEDHEHVK